MTEQYHGTVTPYLRRFVEIVAAERTKDQPDLFDECVQEGMIAAWQAMERHPGKTDTYYRAAAKRGVLNPLRGRSPFGHESMRGSKDASSASQSIYGTNSDGDDVLVVEPSIEAPYAAIDVQGAVREAVAGLDEADRVLVFGRFWEGLSYAEMADILLTKKNRLEWRWMQTIRPALEDALGAVA